MGGSSKTSVAAADAGVAHKPRYNEGKVATSCRTNGWELALAAAQAVRTTSLEVNVILHNSLGGTLGKNKQWQRASAVLCDVSQNSSSRQWSEALQLWSHLPAWRL